MKKLFKHLSLALVGLLAIGGLTWSLLQKNTENPSEEPIVEEYDLATHQDHVFRAIGTKVTLNVTITPADATNKTLTWVSSDPASVEIDSTTATSATLECLAAFSGTVTITVTATQGTTGTSDDVTAICSCTYYVPVQSVVASLTVWNGSAYVPASPVDLPLNSGAPSGPTWDQLGRYKMAYTVLPENATNKNLTFTHSGSTVSPYLYGPSSPWWSSAMVFYAKAVTPAGETVWVTATSVDNPSLSSTVTITVGNHLTADGSGATVSHSTNSALSWESALILDMDIATWSSSIDDYPDDMYINVGEYVYICIPQNDSVTTQFTLTFDSTYFSLVGTAPSDLSAQNTMLIFHVLAATGSTPKVITVDFTNYASSVDLLVPFLVTNPVTGLNLDNTTVTF